MDLLNDAAVTWHAANLDDLDGILAVERQAHPLFPERPDVYRERLRLFGEGCRVLRQGSAVLGYGLSYPWLLDDVPPLDTLMGRLPDAPDCIFIHDVALLRQARAKGAGRAFVRYVTRLARGMGLSRLALVSVYGTWQLWSRCGFEVTALRTAPEKLGVYGETARYMVCELHPPVLGGDQAVGHPPESSS